MVPTVVLGLSDISMSLRLVSVERLLSDDIALVAATRCPGAKTEPFETLFQLAYDNGNSVLLY